MSPDPLDVAPWRPQTFGRRGARQIADPVIEPLWSGVRLLVHLVAGNVELRDAEGAAIERPELASALADAVQADSAVLDGYLTPEAVGTGVGVSVAPIVANPRPADMARQMVLGGHSRRAELVDALEDAAPVPLAAGDETAFVAVDLLLLDGESLLDVPLLERKRLLDGVIVESALVRLGIHVRPPVDTWLGTWRNFGFQSLAYKEANGRYRPGERNDGWATARIPRE
jgi:ATP-dependent DNA ligase